MSGIQSVSVSAAQSYATVGTQTQQSLQPFTNLDLTEAQRTQLRSVFASAKQNGTSQAAVQKEVNAVLTPAQQQTLARDIKADGGHFGGRHHHHDGDASTTQSSGTTSAATQASASTSPSSSILDVITNIQNQAAAAQSTIVGNLQQQVLATNEDTTSS
jgi:hypothetical protein